MFGGGGSFEEKAGTNGCDPYSQTLLREKRPNLKYMYIHANI